MYPNHGNGGLWGYNHMQPQHQYEYMQPYQPQQAHVQVPLVQPHINPHFASAFGIAINAMQQVNQMPPAVQQQYLPQNMAVHPAVGASVSQNLVPTSNNAPPPHSSFHWTEDWKANQGSSYPVEESKNISQ
ncbi:hypothetical protein BYT27DRAFT_6602260 [Phlegmacium glaucopus]|nr:hypothetical protein BYT27DRAFT_6602260 [Phlegmacium glaucopus]